MKEAAFCKETVTTRLVSSLMQIKEIGLILTT